MNSPRNREGLSSLPAEGVAADDAAAPTLARWYRATSRARDERSQHLQVIAEAVALGPTSSGDRPSRRPSIADKPDIQPATVSARPARASSRWLQAAALFVVVAGGAALLALRPGNHVADASASAAESRAVAARAANAAQDVGFALRLADAAVRHVSLAGDFNGWDASTLPMVRDPADGTWRVRIPLAPGRHTYSFVVDGTRWVIDPLAPRTIEGALGPANVIAVSGDL